MGPTNMIFDSCTSDKMTTPKQILKKLRSLRYRQRLLEGMEPLESEILDICEEYNTQILCGYRIQVENGRVKLYKIPEKDYRQMEIGFKDE